MTAELEIGARAQATARCGASGNMVFAALDLGTNNCRLLVARPTRNGFRVIDAFSRIVRLGEGMGAERQLSDAAMERTLDALKACAEKMARRGVGAGRHVATEACRRARNGAEFLDRVKRETGIALEIIDADEEARLALVGCASLLDGRVPHGLILDIGGGSTELVWVDLDGDRPIMRDYLSLPFGVVGLAETYGGDAIPRDVYESMVARVTETLIAFDRRHGIAERVAERTVQMVGTSGTVTTLAGIYLDLPRYNRAKVDGTWLDFDQIHRISRRLAAMNLSERAEHPCIGFDRADLVVAGAAILDAICRLWPIGRLRVADRGLREGILYGLMGRHGFAAMPHG